MDLPRWRSTLVSGITPWSHRDLSPFRDTGFIKKRKFQKPRDGALHRRHLSLKQSHVLPMVLLGLDPLGLGFDIEPEASVEGTAVT